MNEKWDDDAHPYCMLGGHQFVQVNDKVLCARCEKPGEKATHEWKFPKRGKNMNEKLVKVISSENYVSIELATKIANCIEREFELKEKKPREFWICPFHREVLIISTDHLPRGCVNIKHLNCDPDSRCPEQILKVREVLE